MEVAAINCFLTKPFNTTYPIKIKKIIIGNVSGMFDTEAMFFNPKVEVSMRYKIGKIKLIELKNIFLTNLPILRINALPI